MLPFTAGSARTSRRFRLGVISTLNRLTVRSGAHGLVPMARPSSHPRAAPPGGAATLVARRRKPSCLPYPRGCQSPRQPRRNALPPKGRALRPAGRPHAHSWRFTLAFGRCAHLATRHLAPRPRSPLISRLGFTGAPSSMPPCQVVFSYIHLCRARLLRSRQARVDTGPSWT